MKTINRSNAGVRDYVYSRKRTFHSMKFVKRKARNSRFWPRQPGSSSPFLRSCWWSLPPTL